MSRTYPDDVDPAVPEGSRWLHVKTRNEYIVVKTFLVKKEVPGYDEQEWRMIVEYTSLAKDGRSFGRFVQDFLDLFDRIL